MEEIRCNLDKPRLVPYKNTWMPYQNTVYWCNLKLALKKGLQFYQTRSHAIVLYNTLLAICIEKAVCMKTREDFNNKVYQSPRLPRVKLKPNLQSGQQDQPHQEARASSDHQSVSGSCGETHNSSIDYRIPGIPHSTVQQQETNRKETVKQLIQQFENHPHKESFLQDLKQTSEINVFSEGSKKSITDMGKTEIFELPRHNAPTVPYTGKLALCSAHVEDVSNPPKGPNSSTRRTMTPCQFPVTSSKRT